MAFRFTARISRTPTQPDYTLGRFTDGADTLPPALNYFGVWVEQMAAALPAHPAVTASLQGRNELRVWVLRIRCSGTTLFNLTGTPFTIDVDNVGQQIDDYLATHPKIDNHTLFVVWGGANNLPRRWVGRMRRAMIDQWRGRAD